MNYFCGGDDFDGSLVMGPKAAIVGVRRWVI